MATVITVQTSINVTAAQARAWFLSLQDHPERYRFATHEGFWFVQGDFAQVGARFATRERFYGLRLELLFELTGIEEAAFQFRLIRPAWLNVWGAFSVQELTPESSLLRLDIGATPRLGQWLLRFYPLAAAIRQQIAREVMHIRASMEGL